MAKHSQSRLKNEVDSIPIGGGGSQDEPGSPYAAEFPYNYVEESESGHLIEIDDTPTAERVNITHKDGNFIEMHPGGDQVIKVQGDQYTVVIKDNYLYVKGNLNISTDSDMAEYVGGDHVSQILGDEEININCSELDLKELRYSFGLGVTWITQLGPMSLAIATVGNQGPLDRTEGFQFEIGTQFYQSRLVDGFGGVPGGAASRES